MTLVAAGLLNKQVAGEQGISEITVKAHRGQVMQKMKADSLAHLVKMSLSLPEAQFRVVLRQVRVQRSTPPIKFVDSESGRAETLSALHAEKPILNSSPKGRHFHVDRKQSN
jgi:hypothetical protein